MKTSRPGFAHPLDELRDELDRLWGTLVAAPPLPGRGSRPADGVFPAVNVRETPDRVVVEAELPGLDAAGLDIAVTGDELVLKGARPAADEPRPGTGATDGGHRPAVTWHRRERGTGRFERRIPLPVAVDPDRVEAVLESGVLTVTCPKAAESQPRRVEVRSA